MVNVCITKNKEFRDRAKAFNISVDTLEHITYKYYGETDSADREPSDTYIKYQLGEFPYVEKEDVVDVAHKMWELKYSNPLEFNSETELHQAKTLAETYFPKEAIHISINSQNKQVLKVQEPVGKLNILYKKDFQDWHNYNDYLMVMGDAIPESERQKEPRKTGPQPFTFKDGVTVTAPFQPNEQQVEALNAMSDFINSDEVSMTLSGYAGTGKTSLMELIAAKMKKEHKNIVFSASTNKAAAVLRDRVKKAGFTAQTLNKVFGISVEVDSSKPYDAANLVNKLKEAEITPGTIVVIDEASMINEENYRILNDIAKENGLKIIYTGDKGQLAPVGESQISKVFRDKNGRIVTLTKVERTEDNAILKEATAVRNGQPLSGESSFNSEGKGVAYMKPTNKEGKKAIVEAFVPMLKKNPDFFRILAYTNKAVTDYNTAVRNALGYYDNTPRVGEPIVGYSNWGAEYDRRTKQTTYRFINSESYKVVEVKPAKQVYYSLDDGTRVQMTAIPITIEDAMGKREKVDLMDIKGNPQNLQAATMLAKEKATLHSKAGAAYNRGDKKGYAAYKQAENAIEKFLFINEDIKDPTRKDKYGRPVTLHKKTFDFGYAMTVHKSQGSTFTHVLVDDADISTARNQTAPSGFDASVSMLDDPYSAMEGAQAVDLGLDSASSDMQVTSQGNLFAQMQQQPKVLNTQTINREANNAANIRQQLEYVAVSRATDTVTIISNNVKTEDSPLNHLPKAEVSKAASLETNRKEMTPQLIQQVQTILSPLGNKVHGLADIQKYFQEHSDAFDKIQQAIEENHEMQSIKEKAIADGTFMKAPNGKPTNLTERQWLQVRTKAFKKWFGDWEKASKENPYSSEISVTNVAPDYDSADAEGPGAMFAIFKGNDYIGSIAINANYKGKNKFKTWGEKGTNYVSMSSVGDAVEIEEEFRGKGYGKAAYFEFAKQMANMGYVLRSAPAKSRTEASTRVWKSLVRDGYAKEVGDRYEFVNSSLTNASKVVDENGEPKVVYHGTSRKLNNNSFKSEFIFASDNDIIGAGYGFQRKGFSIGIDYALSSFAGEDINSFREHIEDLIKELKKEIELGEDLPFYQEGDLDAKKNLIKELENAKQEIKSRDIFKELEFNIFNIFQNVKNPLTVDAKGKYWHSIEFEGTTKSTDELAKIAKNRGYDGLIVKNVVDKGAEVSKNGEFADIANDYIAFEPNQIKSATDNSGMFSTENDDIQMFITPNGEVYGFVAPNGDIYLDETKISPEHPIHEYTHLWDRIVAKKNPKLWKRGVQLMKKTSLWQQIENNPNYGQRWKALQGMTASQLESLIASEVHARFVGEGGQQLLDNLAKEKGAKGIIGKLKQWMLDFWKELKGTFSNWSDEEINNLTLDDFNKMTVRDLVDKVNLREEQRSQQPAQQPVSITESSGGYSQRTRENAEWSDITLALATDFNTAGEKLTKRVAGDKYVSSTIDPRIELDNLAEGIAADIFEQLYDKNKTKAIKLNIAGNGIYTLSNSYTQEQINDLVYKVLRKLLSNGITISEVRSGGQTGIDEAGIIAAQRLRIPASVHAPKGFLFRTAEGKDIADRGAFESRFNQVAPSTQQPAQQPQQQVVGENISSKGSEFAKRLTNPFNNETVEFRGTKFDNAEHAYQTWKSGKFDQRGFDAHGGKVRGTTDYSSNYQTMVEILTAKLQQHPDLVQGITERGGMDYLNASTHNVVNDSFWETSGQNKFMEALKEAYNKVIQNVEEQRNVVSGLEDNLGGGEQATVEIKDAVKVAKKGMTFEEALAGQEAFFSKEEQAQIKQGLNGRNLQVMSVSRLTDPAFFSKEIVSFLEKNAEKPLNDPTRVTAIEIWSKHDGLPIKDILDACKKYRVAPMVSFSITGLGGTALEGGVMKYQDMLEKVGKLIKNGTLNPATTTVRIDPILPGVTNMDDIRKIVETAKSFGIKKFVTSLVQSYGYTEGTPRDRKVVSGINNALATEGKTYDWDKYYGRDRRGKINFKPKQEVIDEIGKVLLELDKDPEITIQTCAFGIKGLKVSACLDPMIIERITGVDVLRKDGTYDRDTSRPECMCYGCHGDFFKGQNKKCYSSCAYCYAAHSGDNKLNYYNEDGTLKDNDYTRTERIQPITQATIPEGSSSDNFRTYGEAYGTIERDDLIQELLDDGYSREDIQVQHIPATETEDDYYIVKVRDSSQALVNAVTGSNTAPVTQKVSLPDYEHFNDLYEDTEVDAAWKIPILQDLDSQLSNDNTEDENLQILSQMDRVLQSPSQEEYEKAPTPQKEETNKRMEDYLKRNQQLNNLLDNEVGLQASEIRDTAETIMNTLSDIITEIQQHPDKAIEYWPTLKTDRDLSKLSRKEVVEVVNINRLMELAKKRFDELKWSEDPAIDALYNSAHLLDQHDLIMNNWDAVMRFAGDIFVANEGFGIKRNSKKGNYETEVREYQGYDYDDYSSPQDPDAIAEEEDEQEHWQVEAKTIDAINSMSELVRMAIHNCYVLDKNGNKVLDKWGMPKRVDKHKAVKQILYWTAGTLNINEMIDRMEAHKDRNPWVSQLTKRLADTSGSEADFQSQFYGVMHRHFQLYGIGQYEDGHYVHKILNRHNALSEVMKGISAQFQMHQHPLFNRDSTINRENLKLLEGWYGELDAIKNKYKLTLVKSSGEGSREDYVSSNDLELSEADIETAAKAITAASRMLGYITTEEQVLPIINKDSIFRMTNALMLMLDREGLRAQAQANTKDYKPFDFKTKNNIRGALSKFLQPMMEELEETALNTIFEDGKMYQSNTIPSFLSQLFDSFAQSEENFKTWVESFYGNSQWFKKDGVWRTPWLATMMSNPDARKAFEHHVQLNFNKHNYMRNMSPDEYIISCITNYFFNKTKEKEPDTTEAWFRVPIQSNKPSSEFIKFFSFRGTDYKDKIVAAMQSFFHQELDRIDTVRKRNKQEGDASAIASWDEYGRHFMFLPFLNSYLVDRGELVNKEGNDLFRNADSTVDTLKNNELKTLLNKKLDAEKVLTPEEEVRLSKLVEEATRIYMQNRADQILDNYEKNGILKAAEKVENIRDYGRSVRDNIENFLWNDFFAANNILQLTITDKAFYPTTAELQKRLAELHAPGTKANKYATDYQGNRVSDGTYRTILISDYKDFTANIIDNLSEIFDRKIAQAPQDEKQAWIVLKESLVGEKGRYRGINVTDGQAYSSPSSYRKKMLMFGKWSPEAERTYQKIRSGNFTLSDLEAVFQPLKPFVYGHLHKKMGVQNAPIQEMNVPFQAKNSEYLLLMADALMQGQDTGRPNLLHTIYDIMEESERLFPTKGIDTVQFNSAIKSGAQGVVHLSDFTESGAGREQAYTALRKQMYVKNDKGEIVDYNYDTFVQSTDYDNYALQQEVPKHFQDHQQAEPSQKRANIMSDLDMWLNPQGDKADPANINYYTWKDPDGTEHKLNAQEFRKEYERVHAQNIEDSFNDLSKLFHLDSLDRVERNIALSELLQEEIESSPRYGIDLMQACQIDPKTGDFRIPKGDPVQSKRIEQLINSIIKSRVNKQKLAGGPVVQVTNWGTSKQLHIRFNDKKGGLLMTNEEFEAEKEKDPELFSGITYQDYIRENQDGIAHFEIFAPAAWKKHLEKFKNPDGTINLEAVERCDPNLLRMITSRIPNEDKYSIAHGKIVGFLPEVAGEAIMFPYELTEIDDSDFDVDKRYCHVFEIEDIVEDTPKVKELLFKTVADSYKKSHNGTEMPYNLKKKVNDSINMLLDNPEVIRHTDKFSENLYNAYQNILHTKFPYKVKYPKKGSRGDRNNQILNMDWAVMSNEMTASKILNPGGFDIPKHDAYVIAVYRAKDGSIKWEQLEGMTTKQLQKLMPSAGDLAWFDTQVQFYKQNAAGSNLIGVFAVNKVAHALLEADDILVDIEEVCGEGNNFTIASKDFNGRMPLDPSQDDNGAYIGKGLGSMVGASADTAKDPWLDLIGINMTTAGVYNTLLRLGMPQKDAALFMSQNAIVSTLSEFNRTNLEETTTFDAIINKKLAILRNKYGYNENSEINKEPITRDELKAGVLPNGVYVEEYKDKIDYKVLLAFSKLQNLAKAVRKPTLVTRLNSISSAVGPLIIDNIILEHKLMQFLQSNSQEKTGFYSSDGIPVDMDDLFYNHPMLKAFFKAFQFASNRFADMPAGSTGFKNLIEAFPNNIKEKIYEDRQLLSKLSDFYQSYMLVVNEIIKPEQIGNYIKGFPEYFIKAKFKEKYPDNAFIQAIQTTFDKKAGRGFLNINTTGMMEQEKERLRMAWTDLHKVNPKLSTQLFTYAFFRGGIGFSPKTWMGLVSTYVKEHLTNQRADSALKTYVDTYRNFPTDSMVDEIIIEQFVRNNWDNSKLAPKKGGEGTVYDYSELSKGILRVHAQKDKDDLQGIQFMKTTVDKNTYLWKRVTPMEDTDSSIEFQRIMPLGNNGEYMEMSLNENMAALEEVNELKQNTEQPELPNNAPKDAALSGDSSAPAPSPSTTQQAKSITDIVKYMITSRNLNEKVAVDYVATLHKKAQDGTISKFSKQDIQRIAKDNGLNLDVDAALEWFKNLC